ncbi:MAG: DNA polymerase III subunit alpha [candidate division KSB1 bacterium]|nr:DNA polymerase III subunit alpha [candidate division KSB1 bacterium]MDZ7336191.1 DNA polymerase III subunit alpha [candidate division KSB1 bacterium]MDZ7356942.1 DNA polymerase III subunit alpha [candidate division KSB1 bacterium]MDZ7400103.1 DNA polymerase III subunit alpha [candidate division KSB1 bacterium]
MSDFVHLHNHSHYSLLDGACKIEDLIEACREFGMDTLALTDHGNMFGAIEFYTKAREAGIKPIIGAEVYIAPGSRFDRSSAKGAKDASFHLILLAKNETGYKNLMKLVSAGFLEGFYYKPRIDKELLRQHADGLIALSACLKGEVPQRILQQDLAAAERAALEFKDIFHDDFYFEIHRHKIPEEEIAIQGIAQLSNKLNIPMVATNDTHYLKREHAFAHDILLCLQTGKSLEEENRMRFNTNEVYFKSPEEMKQLFHDFPEALRNTRLVADKCNLTLDLKSVHLPRYQVPEAYGNISLDDYLQLLAEQGLRERYPQVTPELEARLTYELDIIKKMGYAGYFLIVKDFIDHARKEKIPVGPGRGSAAGSLVAYVLRITNIDPIQYDLLFERFLNPERVSMPDIDIDFCFERREEIIQYVKKKYGEQNVTQIITFGTMAARGVIRDVGRVLKMSLSEVDKIAKMIPEKLGTTLEKALEQVAELRQVVEQDELHRKLIENSLILEGLARHASTHAAGVVITPDELTNYTPLFKSSQGDVTTQYDMKTLEKIGVLKMDFLGLRTLTVIDHTLKLLKNRGIELDLDQLPLDDPATFQIFCNGETVAIFQFESSGMRDCLRRLKPERIGDLIAMNALYRPGPMDMIDDFIARKHGEQKIEYLHPLMEPILKETYGVMIYQEQVMRVASELAGFSLGGADLLRRAISKKKLEQIKQMREQFVAGAEKKGISPAISNEIFDLIVKFAGYGFNKSHAAGYSLIAYQTAYLKAHYPAEFMAANLTSEISDTSRIVVLIDECKRMGLTILPPDVNESEFEFTVVNQAIRYGLGAIKNVGRNAINSILAARKKLGRFKTIFDLVAHVDGRLVNKKVLESLIQAGAMDSLQGHRAQLMQSIDLAANYAQRIHLHRANGQTSIFDASGPSIGPDTPPLPDVAPWSHSEQLSREKDLLGFYFSGHPLSRYSIELKMFSQHTLDQLRFLSDKAELKTIAMITGIKKHFDRKNRPMAFVTIEDLTATGELIIFADAFEKHRQIVHEDSILLVIGKVSMKNGNDEAKILCDDLIPIDQVWERCVKNIKFSLQVNQQSEHHLREIKNILTKNRGSVPVLINLKTPENGEYTFLSKKITAQPSSALISQLSNIIGLENICIELQPRSL